MKKGPKSCSFLFTPVLHLFGSPSCSKPPLITISKPRFRGFSGYQNTGILTHENEPSKAGSFPVFEGGPEIYSEFRGFSELVIFTSESFCLELKVFDKKYDHGVHFFSLLKKSEKNVFW